jgi:hypothetical protein
MSCFESWNLNFEKALTKYESGKQKEQDRGNDCGAPRLLLAILLIAPWIFDRYACTEALF